MKHGNCDIYGIDGGYFFERSEDGHSQFRYTYDSIENGRIVLRYQCRKGQGRAIVKKDSAFEFRFLNEGLILDRRERVISIPFGFVCKDCGKPWYESSESTADQKT